MAKARKNKADKLPKTIAGVKVPKELRQAGAALLAAANQPLTREIALAALLAAVTASKEARKTARKAAEEAGDAAEDAAEKVRWMGPAVAAAASEVGRRLFDAYKESLGMGGGGRADKSAKAPRRLEAGRPRDDASA